MPWEDDSISQNNGFFEGWQYLSKVLQTYPRILVAVRTCSKYLTTLTIILVNMSSLKCLLTCSIRLHQCCIVLLLIHLWANLILHLSLFSKSLYFLFFFSSGARALSVSQHTWEYRLTCINPYACRNEYTFIILAYHRVVLVKIWMNSNDRISKDGSFKLSHSLNFIEHPSITKKLLVIHPWEEKPTALVVSLWL